MLLKGQRSSLFTISTRRWLFWAPLWTNRAEKTPFAPRCIKDLIEERLFYRRRTVFSQLELVFFDSTSIHFEGEGGDEIGRYGNSKDHQPDHKQMVLGVVLDDKGFPLCCEI
ncbi:MAG: hypothetical protein KGY70_04465 [Bacteroidales bacterium]|nr:hypothetical protein [Bacteroidales bacterium]MBS3774415.1 hypothetical protein [Bacteroidales bacterium]